MRDYHLVAKQLLDQATIAEAGGDGLTAMLARGQVQELGAVVGAINAGLGNLPRGVPVTQEPFTTQRPADVGWKFSLENMTGDRESIARYVAIAGPTPRLWFTERSSD